MSTTVENPSKNSKTYSFQAEVRQVLDLVIHSLYSHREIFLRELISNASDAVDKLRFRSLTEPQLLEENPTLEIRILLDAKNNTITIQDTGIGMSESELIENLGTIAHSGSRKFLEQLKASSNTKDVKLIGQFGVGFYSSYLVADRVDVVSRAAGSQQTYRWSSSANDQFIVEPCEEHPRGTSIILHVREDQKEFLEHWRIRELVKNYSDYIGYPIQLTKPKPEDETSSTSIEFETVNQANALWQRSKQEITEEQYNEFYTHITRDLESPLARTHFIIEGTQQFIGLLFIPKQVPNDWLLGSKKQGIRLFVKRVFIMNDCEELLPPWLRFLRGVIDSDDLPLNVSREILQDSSIVRSIRRQIIKKTFDLLDELAKDQQEQYKTFWTNFGAIFKEGILSDFEHRDRIATLLRFESSRNEGLVSLDEYISRMPEGQEAIYYIVGESLRTITESPHLEIIKKRGYEILYMTDAIDEFVMDQLREYKNKSLISAMRADLKLHESEEEKSSKQHVTQELSPLLNRIQNVLEEHVREVRISDRLTDSPCCLVTQNAGNNAFIERILRERGHQVPKSKRIFEINPSHPLIQNLNTLQTQDSNAEQVREWVELLYDQALLTEGSTPENPHRFAQRMTHLLTQLSTQSATSRNAES